MRIEGLIMEIGKPQRELIVEPLELPEPIRPVEEPTEQPQPEKEPAHEQGQLRRIPAKSITLR
jgi:hypothetical protein